MRSSREVVPLPLHFYSPTRLRGATGTPAPVLFGLWRPLRLSTVDSSSAADHPNLYPHSREKKNVRANKTEYFIDLHESAHDPN